MKFYFVSVYWPQTIDLLAKEKCNLLISYLAIKTKKIEKTKLATYPCDIFLDCGAFTAWAQGEKIDFSEYLKFVIKYQEYFEKIASLDVQPTGLKEEDFQKSAEESFKNYETMKNYVPLSKLVPTFHFGEQLTYLERYVKDKIEVIALGGIAGPKRDLTQFRRRRLDLPWLAKVFQTYPKQKFHGFGLFTKDILMNFPFYSIDSSYWTTTYRFGGLLKYDEKKKFFVGHSYRKRKGWEEILKRGPVYGSFEDIIDPKRNRISQTRERLAIRETKKYIDFITKLWETRGIVWT